MERCGRSPIGQIVLAPVAGFVIAAWGAGPAFAINATSFVVSAAVLRRLDAGGRPSRIAVAGWRGALEGVGVVRRNRLLARLAVVQVLAALSAGATSGLLVVLANEWLGVGPSGFGVLLAAIGLGAAAGPAIFGRWIRPGRRAWLFGPLALRGAVDLVLAAVRAPLAAGVALVAYGIGTSTAMVAYQSTLQVEVDEALRGRAFAFFDVAWQTARLVSLAGGGALADALGVRGVYLAGGLLLLFAFAVGWVPASTRGAPGPTESDRRRR